MGSHRTNGTHHVQSRVPVRTQRKVVEGHGDRNMKHDGGFQGKRSALENAKLKYADIAKNTKVNTAHF